MGSNSTLIGPKFIPSKYYEQISIITVSMKMVTQTFEIRTSFDLKNNVLSDATRNLTE
jgi:hypothetical protein